MNHQSCTLLMDPKEAPLTPGNRLKTSENNMELHGTPKMGLQGGDLLAILGFQCLKFVEACGNTYPKNAWCIRLCDDLQAARVVKPKGLNRNRNGNATVPTVLALMGREWSLPYPPVDQIFHPDRKNGKIVVIVVSSLPTSSNHEFMAGSMLAGRTLTP